MTREPAASSRWFRPNRRRAALLGLGLPPVALLAWGVATFRAPPPDEVLTLRVNVAGEVRSIAVDYYRTATGAAGNAPQPAIILLHGIEGANRYVGTRWRTADRLRDLGYAVFVVHYFDAVDYDDLWYWTDDGQIQREVVDSYIARDSACWIEAVAAVVGEISRRPEIDPQAIAIDGYSLGGFVALSVAQCCEERQEYSDIAAVIVNWGACFSGTQFSSGFPPTLFIHGECDEVVPLDWTRETISRIRSGVGAATELMVVPGAGHTVDTVEARLRTQSFLSQRLPAYLAQ